MIVIYPITVDADTLLSSSIAAETTYPALTAGSTYNLGDRVISGGIVYEALRNGISTWTSPLSAADWLLVRPTARWSMFDGSADTHYTATGADITMSIAVPAVNDVMLLGVLAGSVTVALPNGTRTVSLSGSTPQSVYITDLAGTAGTLTLTLTQHTSGVTQIAEVLIGSGITLGEIDHGAGVGITDYSTRTLDEFGNATIVRRGYSSIVSGQVWLDRSDVDRVLDVLTALRSTPCLWIGSRQYASTLLYGYYKEATMTVAGPNHAVLDLRLESLVTDSLQSGTLSTGGGTGGTGGGTRGGWNWSGWDITGGGTPAPPPPPPPPATSSNVTLLVRGASSIIDVSVSSRPLTFSSSAWSITSSAPALFGSTSAMQVVIGGDGNEALYAGEPLLPDGATDFCVEQFICPADSAASYYFFTVSGGPAFHYSQSTGLSVYQGFSTLAHAAYTLPVGSWSHIAICRSSNTIYVYVNGSLALQFSYSATISFSTISMLQCFGSTGITSAYSKFMRVTINSPVYTSAFSPLSSGY